MQVVHRGGRVQQGGHQGRKQARRQGMMGHMLGPCCARWNLLQEVIRSHAQGWRLLVVPWGLGRHGQCPHGCCNRCSCSGHVVQYVAQLLSCKRLY